MTSEARFVVEDRGPIRMLTISNPGRKNAIPFTGWPLLRDRLADFEASEQRVLLLTGADGDFCSGADISPDEMLGGGFDSPADNAARMRTVGEAAIGLHRSSKPTVAAVDGVAVGAGMNLALGCDIVVAGERARFSEVFVKRGLTVDFGGTWLLPRLVGLAAARELALTGRMVHAPEALTLGLVSRVVPSDDLLSTALEIAEELAAGAPLAQRFIKLALDRGTTMTFEEAIRFEDQAQAVLLSSHDLREGVAAFMEKRAPRFEGR